MFGNELRKLACETVDTPRQPSGSHGRRRQTFSHRLSRLLVRDNHNDAHPRTVASVRLLSNKHVQLEDLTLQFPGDIDHNPKCIVEAKQSWDQDKELTSIELRIDPLAPVRRFTKFIFSVCFHLTG